MNKRLVLGITIGSLLGILLLLIIYFFFFSNANSGPKTVTDVFKSFFPYGQNTDLPPNIEPIDLFPENTGTSSPVTLPRLRDISEAPTAGFTTYDRKATSTDPATGSSTIVVETAIRYMEKSSGHIYEATDRAATTSRISNTTMPKVQEVLFANKNSFVSRRYDTENESLQTYTGSLVPTTPTSTMDFTIKGSFLSPDISQIALFGSKLFTLYAPGTGSSGFISNPLGSKEVKVFSSPLSSWVIDWVGENSILFVSKASWNYPGTAFVFNINNGSFTKILGPVNGLTAKTNPSGNQIIYSESNSSSFVTYYKNNKDNSLLQLGSRTLAEKCIWSKKSLNIVYCAVPTIIPSGHYPDDWYKGLVSFSDSLVKIDLETNTETSLASLQTESGQIIDAISLGLDTQEKHLLFLNKNDGHLWSFEITN